MFFRSSRRIQSDRCSIKSTVSDVDPGFLLLSDLRNRIQRIAHVQHDHFVVVGRVAGEPRLGAVGDPDFEVAHKVASDKGADAPPQTACDSDGRPVITSKCIALVTKALIAHSVPSFLLFCL
jgi:hypothetical protein